MSTWMCPNLLLGCSKSPILDSVWRCILARWHNMQDLAQFLVSFAMPFQTNFSVMSLFVVLLDGCERPWMVSNTVLLISLGIQGLGLPVLTSQRILPVWLPMLMLLHVRDVLSLSSSSSSCCRRCSSCRSSPR